MTLNRVELGALLDLYTIGKVPPETVTPALLREGLIEMRDGYRLTETGRRAAARERVTRLYPTHKDNLLPSKFYCN